MTLPDKLLRYMRKFIAHTRSRGLKSALAKTREKIHTYRRRSNPTSSCHITQDVTLVDPITHLELPDPGNTPRVSVIIPAYNQWRYTYNCIATLSAACKRYTFEVILADDGSTDDTLSAAEMVTNLIVVRDGVNRRFVHNCNNAAKRARGEFIFLLNNDTKCSPDAIDALVDTLINNGRIGIAGSKLIFPNGQLQECGGIIWSNGSAANHGRGSPYDLPGYMHSHQVDYVSGAALMIRTKLWNQLGGFDSRYSPAYYEDADLAMATRAAGFEVWVEPRSMVIHYEGISNGTNTSTGIKAHQVTNQSIFHKKWRATLCAAHHPPSTSVWLAADRPQGKCTILVIDHYVPMADQDAGGACTKHYLSAMVQSGARVVFMGENFHRTEPYTTDLESMGIEVWIGHWFASNWQRRLAEYSCGIDMVLFNRPHVTEKFLPEVRKIVPHAKMIYFGVDLHCLREERAAAFAKSTAERQIILQRAEDARKQESAIYAVVDAVLSISHDEAEQIHSLFGHTNIAVFPAYTFPIRNVAHPVPCGPPTVMFVGGFGHAPNQDGVDWFIQDIWPCIKRELHDARFWIVGSKMPVHYTQIGNGIEALGRISDEDLTDRYSRCHVVLAPLRFGAGVKGKIVQATCEGLPIVTTTIGIEGLSPTLKSHLGSYDDPGEFARRVIAICSSDEANLAFRENSLRLARASYATDVAKAFFHKFLSDNLPSFRWIAGHSEDGWIGERSLLRLSTGSHRLSVWCPAFHFLRDNTVLVATVSIGEDVIARWQHHSTESLNLDLNAPRDGIYTVTLSRATIPFQVGIGDDSRALGLRITNLTTLQNSLPT